MQKMTVVVPLRPERATTVFTQALQLEGAVGTRLYDAAGAWRGTVSDWDPARSLSFTWHPDRDPQRADHVTVAFEPVADGTYLHLTTTGDGTYWQELLAELSSRG
ncbi:hypothetical protein E1263_39300 [Kribbella antibiotica]|uniref:Activator of Hsp90 ATPase homologue 1/2-like C-terminal domain-containing protein n=1 Tax=Kribbella antibiotica TaxID=190195 RepID=A0A4R4YJT7_9ACTN|nr:SRPBCC domain-containing protein [Kribbella antibiotica]TDD45163.1 hypothetical protein E1263_39300 [Kribbella antibiotica]